MKQNPSGLLGVTSSQKKIGTKHSWYFRGAAGWYVGVALQHYRCHTIVAKATRAAQISDTVEFRHHHLTQPEVTPMDRIVHGVNKPTCALQNAPHTACDNQLFAINALHQVIQRWTTSKKMHVQKRPGPHLYTLTANRALSCDLCAVPKKTDPPRHFQGWSFQSLPIYSMSHIIRANYSLLTRSIR